MLQIFFVMLLAFPFVLCQTLYKKVIHSTNPQALCLDGTPPVLYYSEGQVKNKFLIFFDGGGLCTGLTQEQTIINCYQRSKTLLGSSKYWPQTPLQLQYEGILSTDSKISDFANWTKIFFGYCDGALHQGYRKEPIEYNGTKIYFRGSVITRSHFKWIMQKYQKFKSAQQVVLAGLSAGAVGSYIWSNYVRTLVDDPEIVLTIPDSGIFLETKTCKTNIELLRTGVMNTFKLANVDEKTPIKQCNDDYKGQQYYCLSIEFNWKYLNSKILLINSEYDSWEIQNYLLIFCLVNGTSQYSLAYCNPQQKNCINLYHIKFQQFIKTFVYNKRHSAWTIGCSNHVYTVYNKYFNSQNQKISAKTGLTIKQAINLFVFQKKRVVAIDSSLWPGNIGCTL